MSRPTVPVTPVSYQMSTCLASSARPNVNTAKYGPRRRRASAPTTRASAAAVPAPASTGSGHGKRLKTSAVV